MPSLNPWFLKMTEEANLFALFSKNKGINVTFYLHLLLDWLWIFVNYIFVLFSLKFQDSEQRVLWEYSMNIGKSIAKSSLCSNVVLTLKMIVELSIIKICGNFQMDSGITVLFNHYKHYIGLVASES